MSFGYFGYPTSSSGADIIRFHTLYLSLYLYQALGFVDDLAVTGR